MKKRNPLAVFFLSIITLGIYDIYWLVKTKSELNQKTQFRTPTIWLLFAPILILIIGAAIALATADNTSTSLTLISVAVDAIMIIAIIPISFIWFLKFSKGINQYTNGAMSTGVAFLTLWLLHQIGVALVQDSFNDVIAGGGPSSRLSVAALTQSPLPPAPTPMASPHAVGLSPDHFTNQAVQAPGSNNPAVAPPVPPTEPKPAAPPAPTIIQPQVIQPTVAPQPPTNTPPSPPAGPTIG